MEQNNAVLVLNAGSSSLKFKIFEESNLADIGFGLISGIGTDETKLTMKDSNKNIVKEEILDSHLSRDNILSYVLDTIMKIYPINIKIVGHRVVHGGMKYTNPVQVTDEVIEYLNSIYSLAPLHNPHNVAPMEIFKKLYPNLIQVACFDTAFHGTNPNFTRYYPIPRKLIDEDKILRYGFHGISYEYIASQLKAKQPNLYNGKVVICHLGAGASLCALVNGKSYTTTMGLTPLDGLAMGTRCGSIDPSIIFYLAKNKNMSLEDIEFMLFNKSGVLGISEKTSDFGKLVKDEDAKCKEAWTVYSFNVIKHIGSLITAMGGIDGIVFTAGVGENSAKIRKEVADSLKFLGLEIDDSLNKENTEIFSTANSKIRMMVIPTQEELMIAKHSLSFAK